TLNRDLNKANIEGRIKGISPAVNSDNVVHQHFVDETMMFGEAIVLEAIEFKQVVVDYEEAYDQLVNFGKSS
ncbi:hypothetical protein KI387_043350, partial [Taxus chinensis]